MTIRQQKQNVNGPVYQHELQRYHRRITAHLVAPFSLFLYSKNKMRILNCQLGLLTKHRSICASSVTRPLIVASSKHLVNFGSATRAYASSPLDKRVVPEQFPARSAMDAIKVCFNAAVRNASRRSCSPSVEYNRGESRRLGTGPKHSPVQPR
jgi:hypothetical protein